MTQTFKRVPGQRAQVRRLGFVYAYDTLRTDVSGTPTTGIEVGYVGKTVQRLSARDDQHRGLAPGPDGTPARCQPFSDLIVGSVRIVEQGMWTDAELAEREVFHIHRLTPRYNRVDNPSPARIPIYEARRHRDNRDRARGLEPRVWPSQQDVNVPRVRVRCRPVLSRKAKRAIAWTCGWFVSFVAAWLALALAVAPHWHQPWRVWPILAAGVCTEPLVFLARVAGKRRTRDLRRFLAGLIAVATVVLVLVAN